MLCIFVYLHTNVSKKIHYTYPSNYNHILSAFFHSDWLHLLSNITSFHSYSINPDCTPQLILKILVITFCVKQILTHELLKMNHIKPYRSIGFSGVLFGLNVILRDHNISNNIRDIIKKQLMTPNACLIGHVSGMIAGYIYINYNLL